MKDLSSITIFWMRRDLRLEDNHGLYRALSENKDVLILFIFDKVILDDLEEKDDSRVTFIHNEISALKSDLEKKGFTLMTYYGDPIEFFKNHNPKSVYTNHDYEPYARKRDDRVKKILDEKNIPFRTFKDQIIFEKDEILKDDGDPYVVYTPYSKKWKDALQPLNLKEYPSQEYQDNFYQAKPEKLISLDDMGFKASKLNFPTKKLDKNIIKEYSKKRDIPSLNGTSRLSVHLRFGTVSIRKLSAEAQELSKTWLNELIWRNFYMMILWHYPDVVDSSFKSKYDNIEWRNNEEEFKAWCEGKTGYPIVDAGMRELNESAYMHNRVRMITASFLTKHLLIDWRWGEAYFAKKLLDYELASNNGGWQWAAGSGCDAAPYFRVFNPELQTKKFDPELKYIKKWVPEFQEISYQKPIVDHKFARERALETYKKGLNS